MRTYPSKPSDLWPYALLIIAAFIVTIGGEIVTYPDDDLHHRNARINLRSQLLTIRSQIELYNIQNPGTAYDAATALETFWNPLVQGDYLQADPINPVTPNPVVNDPTAVAATPAAGGAWVWFEASPGDSWTLNLYAVDEDGNLYSDPDTGQPY